MKPEDILKMAVKIIYDDSTPFLELKRYSRYLTTGIVNDDDKKLMTNSFLDHYDKNEFSIKFIFHGYKSDISGLLVFYRDKKRSDKLIELKSIQECRRLAERFEKTKKSFFKQEVHISKYPKSASIYNRLTSIKQYYCERAIRNSDLKELKLSAETRLRLISYKDRINKYENLKKMRDFSGRKLIQKYFKKGEKKGKKKGRGPAQQRGILFERLIIDSLNVQGWKAKPQKNFTGVKKVMFEELDFTAYKDGVHYTCECKWKGGSNSVSAKEVRDFLGKLMMRPNSVGVFLSVNKFPAPVMKIVEMTRSSGIDIVFIEKDDIENFIYGVERFETIINDKIRFLNDNLGPMS